MERDTLKEVKHNIRNLCGRMIIKLAALSDIDLLSLAYRNIGVLNYRNLKESGELFLVSNWLKGFLTQDLNTRPCFFDVGANVGDYCRLLSSFYSNSVIHAFEPNPHCFNQLRILSETNSSIFTHHMAMGESEGEISLYTQADNPVSDHSTVFPDVLTKAHHYEEIRGLKVPVTTIDKFCFRNHVQRIDLLKIDTEGYELMVLRGAEQALKNGIIRSIQFEFNEMNIYSRVFLRDFFDLLTGYNFYRLLPQALTPVRYSSKQEIFLFQNFLAVRRDLDTTKS